MGYNPGSSAKKVLKAQILVPRRGLQHSSTGYVTAQILTKLYQVFNEPMCRSPPAT
jgi:hypothetical protein